MKKALLVIDMQNVCVGEKHAAYFKYNNRELIRKVNKIIDANEKNLVVYIQHQSLPVQSVRHRLHRQHL